MEERLAIGEQYGREAARLATLERLGAVRPEADRALQEVVDEVRGTPAHEPWALPIFR